MSQESTVSHEQKTKIGIIIKIYKITDSASDTIQWKACLEEERNLLAQQSKRLVKMFHQN